MSLTGIKASAVKVAGGVLAFYMADKAVIKVVNTAGEASIQVLTSAAGVTPKVYEPLSSINNPFKLYEVQDDTSGLVGTWAGTAAGNGFEAQVGTLGFPSMTKEVRNELEVLANAKVVVIGVDLEGDTYKVSGAYRGATITAIADNTGVAAGDLNAVTVTTTANEPKAMLFLSDADATILEEL